MTKTLPVLISIPHGGTKRPPELEEEEGILCITRRDQFDDSDPFTAEIYDLGGAAAKVVKAEIARAYVDPNRPVTMMPPEYPDGVIKGATCYGRPIYARGREPGPRLSEELIRRYYTPYHSEIEKACAKDGGLRLCLDCHSMAAVAPPAGNNSGRNEDGQEGRPLFCLSNLDGRTCPDGQMERLARRMAESFGIGRKDISLNRPFRGGHITESFGLRGPLPWIQVEMNRSLYLDDRWFDWNSLDMDRARLAELNCMFRDALAGFFECGM